MRSCNLTNCGGACGICEPSPLDPSGARWHVTHGPKDVAATRRQRFALWLIAFGTLMLTTDLWRNLRLYRGSMCGLGGWILTSRPDADHRTSTAGDSA